MGGGPGGLLIMPLIFSFIRAGHLEANLQAGKAVDDMNLNQAF
jgi:hypothetical protein